MQFQNVQQSALGNNQFRKEREQSEVAWAQAASESAYKNAALQLQAAIPKEAFLWSKVVNAVSRGKTYEEVLNYAKEHDIDLICMCASGTRFILGALSGSNTDRVLRQAPCSGGLSNARPGCTCGKCQLIWSAFVLSVPLCGFSKAERLHAGAFHLPR